MTSIALPRPVERNRDEIYHARFLIAFAVTLASVMELVDTSIVNVAIPHMMGNLGATLEEIAWVSTGYIVANVVVLPITSYFSDTFGRRNYYTGSIALFTLASFFCGHAHTLGELVGSRVAQGIGGAALISTAQAILFDVFPREERGVATAIFGMGVMVGPTLGPTLGGWITTNYSWPWIFYINVPLGILAGLLCWEYVPEPSAKVERKGGIDFTGLALLAIGIGCLQIMLERGEAKDWFSSQEIIIEAILAVVGIVSFVWRELTVSHPMVDLRILKNRQLTVGVVFAVLLGFALYASVFALPVFLQRLLNYSPWDTGLVILPGALASAFTMAFVGKLSQKMDARPLVVMGVLLFLWAMILHWHFTTEIAMSDTLLADDTPWRGAGVDLHPADRIDGGRSQAAGDGTGDGAVQPVAPARGLARHRGRGESACSLHRPRARRPVAAPRSIGSAGGVMDQPGDGGDAASRRIGAGSTGTRLPDSRPQGAAAGVGAGVREALPGDGHHVHLCAAVAAPVPHRAGVGADPGTLTATAWRPPNVTGLLRSDQRAIRPPPHPTRHLALHGPGATFCRTGSRPAPDSIMRSVWQRMAGRIDSG